MRAPSDVTVLRPGGRRVAVEVHGPRDGAPVLYLHGLAGSPLRRCPRTTAAVEAAGVRLAVVSRPGFGRSDPQPGRTLLDFPADAEAVADALGWGPFAVLGCSAGGPYAAAVGRALPGRVAAAALVSGTAPLWPRRPWAPSRRLEDAAIALGPWGFDPAEVRCEVHLWHGAQDALVPVGHALAHARAMPRRHETVLLGEGHFFLRRHLPAVFGGLAGALAGRQATKNAAARTA